MARSSLERKATQTRVKRSTLSTPPEFVGDPIVWAAWLYYEERMTQEEVADRLGVSRASVVNFLQEARDRGVVTISVSSEHLQTVRASRELSKRFDLESCVVIPDDGGRLPDYERIGRAGARLLSEILEPNDILGVSWGRTVLALSTALPRLQLPHLSIVQITGSAIGTFEFSPELCTSNIANRLGARCINLHAPGIVSKPEVKKLFMQEPALVEQFKLIRSCNKILFGVANLSSASTALRSGYMTSEKLRPYVDGGAIGVMAGRFFDSDGDPVLGPLDEQMIGISLREIAKIPERICVAGGAEKVEAIEAMLRGGYATSLITDEATARALVERA
jgi:DNA-binding transcriptional regulator LsrR (DeoR family)